MDRHNDVTDRLWPLTTRTETARSPLASVRLQSLYIC
jgi:hypothetical protein